MTPEEKKAWAVGKLCEKATELNRIPKKEDFDSVTRSRIKAFLGPWPRALEASGLKEPTKRSVNGKNRCNKGEKK